MALHGINKTINKVLAIVTMGAITSLPVEAMTCMAADEFIATTDLKF